MTNNGGGALPMEIAHWAKNAKESIRVHLDIYQGTPVFSARTYYAAVDGSWKPTRKGLTLSVQHLPALLEAVSNAEHQARSTGLIR